MKYIKEYNAFMKYIFIESLLYAKPFLVLRLKQEQKDKVSILMDFIFM